MMDFKAPMQHLAVGLCAALLALGAAVPERARAQAAFDTVRVAADSAESRVVYATERTTAEKVLAFPSTLLHWMTRPVGAVVIWAERNEVATRVENVFWNDARTFGVFPTARLGGSTLGAVGLTARHERLFGTPREAEARFLYSGPGDLEAMLSYQNPAPFGEASFVDLGGRYRTDSDENLFLDPDLGEAGGETSYRIEQLDAQFGLGADPRTRAGVPGLGWGVFVRYEWNEIGRGDGDGARRFPADLPGAGTAQLVTTGAALLLERTRGGRKGVPRTVSGGRLFVAYDFTNSLGGASLSFHRVLGEWQRFVPLPFLGPYRRLAFRARAEKLFPVPGEAIPFYKRPALGSAKLLRGAEQNRYRGEGALLFTLEYRYPIWETWDALLFVDSGQTFDAFGEIAAEDFRWSGGAGVRVYAGSGVSLRLDVGIGAGGVRAFSEAGPSFTETTRR